MERPLSARRDDFDLALVREQLFGQLVLVLPSYVESPALLLTERWLRLLMGPDDVDFWRAMRAWEDRIRARLSVVHSRSATGGPLRSPVLELLVEVGLAARAYCLRVADTAPSPLAAVLRAYGERTRSMFDDSPSQRVLDNAPPRRLHLSALGLRERAGGARAVASSVAGRQGVRPALRSVRLFSRCPLRTLTAL